MAVGEYSPFTSITPLFKRTPTGAPPRPDVYGDDGELPQVHCNHHVMTVETD